MKRSIVIILLILALVLCLACSLNWYLKSEKEPRDLFPGYLDTASCYLVWDSEKPQEYYFFEKTPLFPGKNNQKITVLEEMINTMTKIDCYMIDTSAAKLIGMYSETSVFDQNAAQDQLAEILDNCRFKIYAVDSAPVYENGMLKISDMKYAIFSAKDIAQRQDSDGNSMWDRWVIVDSKGYVIIVGCGSYHGFIDTWWSRQNTFAYSTDDKMVTYIADRVGSLNCINKN